MGLDMYLRATEYLSRYDYTENSGMGSSGGLERNENEVFASLVAQFGVSEQIDQTGFSGLDISFPMGYWRKANQIHKWFVDVIGNSIDECQTMFVSRANLEELKDLCKQVLANRSLADELLPTGAGFFFGSESYDEYYFRDLKYTVEVIDRCLASKFDYFEYQASW
jgi:hypothetical protein